MTKYQETQIYLKNENRTADIAQIEPIDSGASYNITFNNANKYRYSSSNVRIVKIDPTKHHLFARFDYLKELASSIVIKNEDNPETENNILAKQYADINPADENTILYKFLLGTLADNANDNSKLVGAEKTTNLIFPFGFNASQKSAVDQALISKVSIIEGPPGTGKTQTILNIIANAIINNQSVAIVANNNAAIQNISDKLKKYEIDFVAAYLGNLTNKKSFIEKQTTSLTSKIKCWTLTNHDLVLQEAELESKRTILETKLSQKNELAVLEDKLSALETEKKYFLEYFTNAKINFDKEKFAKINNSNFSLKMSLLLEEYIAISEQRTTFKLIKYIVRYFKFFKKQHLLYKLLKIYPKNDLVTILQKKFYELEISEVKKNIASLKEQLDCFNFNQKMTEYADLSMQIFKARLAKKYTHRLRKTYNLQNITKNYEDFIQDYPVILSTTYSLRNSLSKKIIYDYVIIDEASQVDLCSGSLALSLAKKLVIVGDTKQLQHVSDKATSTISDNIFNQYDLPEQFRYKSHSLLAAVIKSFPNAPKTLLREHYRCHPLIIGFCNKKFYNGQLITLTKAKTNQEPLIIYKTRKGNHARNKLNQRQIDVITEEIIPQQKLSVSDGSLGIVTPYRNQANALQKVFQEFRVKADTADKFQGQENKVVILSTVDNQISKFTDNPNRLNVAVSRAIDKLILVINDTKSLANTNIGDLVKYIEYNNFTVIESKVYSVFDYLYKDYTQLKRKLLKNSKFISKYDSENLIYKLITDILVEKKIYHFEIIPHIPMRSILRDITLLTNEEKLYALNPATHIDFLIYSKIDKAPQLAIEVDGVSFHAKNSRQAKRDILKNKILKKYDLKLLRISTDGSNEYDKIVNALNKITSL